MRFDVIDLKTGTYPDLEDIVLNEEWAKGLDGYEMEGFYIGQDGTLCIADEFGNYAFCPNGRFKIIMFLSIMGEVVTQSFVY